MTNDELSRANQIKREIERIDSILEYVNKAPKSRRTFIDIARGKIRQFRFSYWVHNEAIALEPEDEQAIVDYFGAKKNRLEAEFTGFGKGGSCL